MFSYRPAGTWGTLLTKNKTHILAGESILGGRTRCGQDRIKNYSRGGYVAADIKSVRETVTCDGCVCWAAKQLGNASLTYRMAQGVLVSWGRCEEYDVPASDGGPWVSFCEDHGLFVQHMTKRDARGWAGDPMVWCQECQHALRDGTGRPIKVSV